MVQAKTIAGRRLAQAHACCYIALMSDSPLDRSQLRRRLDDVLRTDPDLNAFCLDYYPEVHRRFAGGMERTEKVNLLLQLAPEPYEILDKLVAYSATPGQSRHFPRSALALAIALTLALSAGIYARFLRHTAPAPEGLTASSTTTPGAGLAGSSTVPVGANSDNVIDTSPSAEMHNSARLPAEKSPACVNCGNRIQGSRGAKMDNRVTVTP